MMQANKRYYGWAIVLTLALTETISWGIIYYAFTVFITPMEVELGWSRTQLAGGFSLALLVMGAMAFPVGVWIDKHGSRLLMTSGSIFASLLIVAWSQVTDLTTFYLIWAGLGACGAAVLYEPAFAVIATWFVKKRGKALAIITFAAGLASTIFIPLSDALLNRVGWRAAVLSLGLFLAITTIPLHAFVLRRHPHDLGLLPDGGEKSEKNSQPVLPGKTLAQVLNSRFFWLLTLAFSLSVLAAESVRVHFIPFLIDTGIDASTAALASGSIGLLQVAGRLVFAPLEVRLPSRVLVAGVFALQGIAMSVLLVDTSLWMIGVFIGIFGTSYGARTLARATIVADQFGASHYGRISSVMAIFLTTAGMIAPVGTGLLYDRFGSYDLALWLITALMVAATTIMILAKPQRDVEAYATTDRLPQTTEQVNPPTLPQQ